MAKQLKRVTERYVAQQESYRNLPVPRPQASPVDVTAEPTVDPAAERLRDIAEGLSALGSGISDFFKMEKSFEETNRMEAEVRGRLGLEMGKGRGFLDYGTRYGYEQGKGISEGQDVLVEISRRLAEAEPDLHPDKLKTADDVRRYVDNMVSEVERDILGDLSGHSRAYLEGVAPALAKAKLEARVKALTTYDANVKLETVNNYTKYVNSIFETDIMPYINQMIETPGESVNYGLIRNKISELTKVARDTYNIDRNTANVLTLEQLDSNLKNTMVQAITTDSSLQSIRTIEGISTSVLMALDEPDEGGFKLTQSADPETKRAAASLRETALNFNNTADVIRGKKQKEAADSKIASLATRVFLGESLDKVRDEFKEAVRLGEFDNEVTLSVITKLHELDRSGAMTPVSQDMQLDYISRALSGRMTSVDVLALSMKDNLPNSLTRDMLQAVDAVRSTQSWQHQQVMQAYALENAEIARDRRLKDKIVKDNKDLLTSLLVDYSGEQLEYIKYALSEPLMSMTQGVPVDPEDLRSLIQNTADLWTKVQTNITKDIAKIHTTDKDYRKKRARVIKAEQEVNTPGFLKANTTRYTENLLELQLAYERLSPGYTGPKRPSTTGGAVWTNEMNQRPSPQR